MPSDFDWDGDNGMMASIAIIMASLMCLNQKALPGLLDSHSGQPMEAIHLDLINLMAHPLAALLRASTGNRALVSLQKAIGCQMGIWITNLSGPQKITILCRRC